MTDFESLAEYLNSPYVMSAMVIVNAIAVVWMFRKRSDLKLAEELVETQYVVLPKDSLDHMRKEIPQDKRALWDELIAEIKGPMGHPVRKGHLFAVLGIIEDGLERTTKIPAIHPPADRPYALPEDVGVEHFRNYMLCMTEGQQIQAYSQLKAGADKGSPICMTTYGDALIAGKVPGHDADVGGLAFVERAIAKTDGHCGLRSLGWHLLQGRCIQQDVPRALELLEKAAQAHGADVDVIEVAEVFRDGMHGIPANEQLAAHWALKIAPKWRQGLHKLGLSQKAWVDAQIAMLNEAREHFKHLSASDRARYDKQFSEMLKPRRNQKK